MPQVFVAPQVNYGPPIRQVGRGGPTPAQMLAMLEGESRPRGDSDALLATLISAMVARQGQDRQHQQFLASLAEGREGRLFNQKQSKWDRWMDMGSRASQMAHTGAVISQMGAQTKALETQLEQAAGQYETGQREHAIATGIAGLTGLQGREQRALDMAIAQEELDAKRGQTRGSETFGREFGDLRRAITALSRGKPGTRQFKRLHEAAEGLDDRVRSVVGGAGNEHEQAAIYELLNSLILEGSDKLAALEPEDVDFRLIPNAGRLEHYQDLIGGELEELGDVLGGFSHLSGGAGLLQLEQALQRRRQLGTGQDRQSAEMQRVVNRQRSDQATAEELMRQVQGVIDRDYAVPPEVGPPDLEAMSGPQMDELLTSLAASPGR